MSKTAMLQAAYNFTSPFIKGNNYSTNTLLSILEEVCGKFVEHLFETQNPFCAFFSEDFDSDYYYCSDDLALDLFEKYYRVKEKPKAVLVKQIANFPFSTLSEEKLHTIHAAISANTTTICPECLNTHLLELSTLNQKICPDCGTQIEWKLEKGQKPAL